MSGTDDEDADEDRLRHGSSFGARAAAYAEHRPDYPAPAISWALAPVHGRVPLRVVDLGAGTGKLTGTLTRCADRVLAVEPDPAMLAELRRAVPGATVVAGCAEQIPLADGTVDAVIAGQAAHWFDLPRAVPEIARVLAPGGVMAGLWNTDDDRVGWVAGLAKAAPGLASVPLSRWRAIGGDSVSLWLSPGTSGEGPSAASAPGWRSMFGAAQDAEFEHWQLRTADSLVDTISTHSSLLLMEPAERERVLAAIRGYLRSRAETSSGQFRLPLVTCAMRAVRAAPP